MFTANICLRLEVSFDGDPLNAFCLAVGSYGRRMPPSSACAPLGGQLVARAVPAPDGAGP